MMKAYLMFRFVAFVFLGCSRQSLVFAQNRVEVNVDYQISSESISQAVIGKIDGSGNADLTQLQIESSSDDEVNDVHLEAALIMLDRNQKSNTNFDDAFFESAGLGARGTNGEYYICCSESAIQAGTCNEENLGKLIAREDVSVRTIPATPGNGTNTKSNSRRYGMRGVVWFSKTSHVAVVFGNCHPDGLSLHVEGRVIWTSYVVGSMFPAYLLITSLHIALCVWYYRLMLKNRDSRIKVEEWIFLTIALATLTALFETVLFATELYGSNEIMAFKIISMLLSLAKHSVTRCLYLVLSLGLGVATASLSKITTSLIAIFLFLDLSGLWSMHLGFYVKFGFHFRVAAIIVRVMEAIFSVWIPVALCRTMYFLKLHEENMKLVRYRWFMRIYFLAAGLSLVETGLMYVDKMIDGGRRFNRSTLREGNDIIYLVILACVAILWKPNPSQQMYAYVLLEDDNENNAIRNDAMRQATDLELSEVVSEQFEDEGSDKGDDEKTSTII